MRGKKKPSKGGLKPEEKLIQNDNNMLFKGVNHMYKLFTIVRSFTFNFMWKGSCLAFMFIMPIMFEVLTEQEAVLDKI